MDWLKNLIDPKKSNSNKKHSTEKYHVRSDKKIVKAHKNPNGPGYVYRKTSKNGIRNIPIKQTVYSSKENATKKLAKIKNKS